MKSTYQRVGACALFAMASVLGIAGTAAPASASGDAHQSVAGRQLNAGDAGWSATMPGSQQQNAYLYSFWNFQGAGTGYWNVDQQMKIQQRAKATYWAMLWNWTGATYGGYLGLQTNGQRFDGSTGDTAIFSLWNANASSGPHCGIFGGEGNGYSCRLAYSFTKGTYYRYRLWRLTPDSGGQWWGAWIENMTTSVDTYIGSIRVSASYTLATGAANFVEYFGTAVPCNMVPVSKVIWTQPAANSQGGGVYQYGSMYSGMSKGSCTGGSATPVNLGWTQGVKVILGG